MNNNLRRIGFIISALFICAVSMAQTVGYSHKPLAAEGCSMKYSVAKQDTSYYIIATVSSDRLRFLGEPQMKIRTFNDEIISLHGVNIGNGSQSAGMVIGNIVYPITEINSTAQFLITPQQFELLKDGVAKIRISMTPMNHEKSFKKDKIGKKLYDFFIKQQSESDDF